MAHAILLIVSIIIALNILQRSVRGRLFYVFDPSLMLIVPPTAGLFWFFLISQLYFGRIKEKLIMDQIYAELAMNYSVGIVILSCCVYLFRRVRPKFWNYYLKAEIVSNSNAVSFFIFYAIFYLLESVLTGTGVSFFLKKIFSDVADLFFVLFFASIAYKMFFQSLLYVSKALFYGLIVIIILLFQMYLTGDKGSVVGLVAASIMIIMIKVNLQTGSYTNAALAVFVGGALLSLLNFSVIFWTGKTSSPFINLTELFETDIFINHYHIFHNNNCVYVDVVSIWDGFRVFFGGEIHTNDTAYMKACHAIEFELGHGKGFGLMSEAILSFGILAPLYFGLVGAFFVFCFDIFLKYFGFAGILLYSGVIEVFYKLYRIDSTYTLINVYFSLASALIVYLLIRVSLAVSGR